VQDHRHPLRYLCQSERDGADAGRAAVQRELPHEQAAEVQVRRDGRPGESARLDRRTERTLITLKLDADEQEWLDLNEALRVAYERIEDIKIEAGKRKAGGADTFLMNAPWLSVTATRSRLALHCWVQEQTPSGRPAATPLLKACARPSARLLTAA
jgi:hypothetical protein